MKHKKFFYAVLLAVSVLFALALSACAKDNGQSFSIKEDRIWLDRYEERTIELETGDASALTWSSSDETVVTVSGGLAVAQGEGTATVTATSGKYQDTITVTVSDSGERPRLTVEDPSAYLDTQTDFGVTIEYLTLQLPVAEYEVEIADPTVATFADGKITGNKIGSTSATVTAQYKGLELENTFTLTCHEAYEILVENTEIDIYNTTNETIRSAEIQATLLYCGAENSSAELLYTVETGADYVTVSGNTVTAKGVGEATIKVAYAEDSSVSVTVSVHVHDNYIEENFINSSVLDVTYDPYTGDEEIGGRKEGVYVYQQNEGSSYYDCRVFVSRRMDMLRDVYAEGARYFAYDIYYTSDADLYLGLDYKTYFPVYDRFESDWLMMLDSEGNVINRPVNDEWFTIVYDLYALVLQYPSANAAFYLVQTDDTPVYVSNIRWWLDNSFFQPEEEVTFTQGNGYTSATANEFVLFHNTNEEAYAPYDGNVGGREGVMKYTTEISTWQGALANRSSLGDSAAYGIENLRSHGSYFTFDIYIEQAKQIYLAINQSEFGASIFITPGTTDISNLPWLYLINEEGLRLDTLYYDQWITVGIRYSEYFVDNAWRATMMFSSGNVGDVIYIDNLCYYADDLHIPDQFASSTLPKGTTVTKDGESIVRVTEGEMAGTILYQNASDKDASADFGKGIKFTDVIGNMSGDKTGGSPGTYFDDPENKFLSFEMYIGNNTTGIGYFAQASTGSETHFISQILPKEPIVVGELFSDRMNVYNLDGSLIDTLEAKTWYKVYLPMEDGGAEPQWVSLILTVYGGSPTAPSELYIRNIAAAHENPYATENVTEVVARKSNIQVRYVDDFDGEPAIKYVDAANDSWGGGIGFAAIEDKSFWETDNVYLQFEFYIKSGSTYRVGTWVSFPSTGTAQASYNIDTATVGETFTSHGGVYVYRNRTQQMTKCVLDKWYTVLLVIPTQNGEIPSWTNTLFFVGGTEDQPSEVYIRGIKYVDQGEDYMEFRQASGTLTKFKEEGEFLNTMQLVNGDTANWDNGIKFLTFENRMIQKIGANTIQFDVYFVDAVKFSFKQYFNDGSYNPNKEGPIVELGKEINDPRIKAKDADGNDVTVINTGAWYTITFTMTFPGDHTIESYPFTSWSFLNFVPMVASSGETCTTYMRNIQYLSIES